MGQISFKKNQWFRWGFAGILALAGILWAFDSLKTPAMNGIAPDESPKVSSRVRTEERARLIGKTLIEKKFELIRFVTVSQKRSMASVEEGDVQAVTQVVNAGQYGRDAWGQPLNFKVADGKVFIWSMGENHHLDSSMDQILSNNAANDDIVVSMSL